MDWQITRSDVTLTNSISQEISMMKRSFFLTAAAGLFASVVLAAPSRAGSEVLSFSFALAPSTTTATDLEVVLSGPVPLTGYTVTSPAGNLPITSVTGSGDTITIDFTASSATKGTVDIMVPAMGLGLTGSQIFTGVSPAGSLTGTGLQINITSVPEPTSMALLGIGMTGFLAFRRLFKRTSAA
jgi:hypothetical protein